MGVSPIQHQVARTCCKMGDGGAAEKLCFGKMMSTGSIQVGNRVGGAPLEMCLKRRTDKYIFKNNYACCL